MLDKKNKLYTLISLITIGLNTINTIILNMQKYALISILNTCKNMQNKNSTIVITII